MNQDILVFAIVLAAISYVGFSLFRSLSMKKVNNGCNGCTGCELTKKVNCNC